MEQPEGEASDGSTAAAGEARTPSPPPPPSPALPASTSGSIDASSTSQSPAPLPPPKQPAPAVEDDSMEQPKREGADSSAAADEALSPSPSPPPSPVLSAATSPKSRSASQQLPQKKLAPGAVIASGDTGILERVARDSTAAGAGPRSPAPPPSPAPPSTTPGFLHPAAAPTSNCAAPSQPPEQHQPSAEPVLAAMAKANGVAPDSSSTAADDAPTASTSSPSSFRSVVGASAASVPFAKSSSSSADPSAPQEQRASSGRHPVASTSRVADPSWPLEQHAFSASAACNVLVALEGDDIWSIVLAKFSRRRCIDFDVAAAPFLHPCSSKGVNSAEAPPLPNGGVVIDRELAADDPMEQPKRDAAGFTAAADQARFPTSPSPPSPALSAATSGSVHAWPTSRSPAQLLPPKKRARRAAIVGDDKGILERDATDSTEAGAGPRCSTPPPSPALPSPTTSFLHVAPNSSSAAPSQQPTEQHPASAEHERPPMAKANGVPGDSSSTAADDAPTAPASPSSSSPVVGAFAASGAFTESSSRAMEQEENEQKGKEAGLKRRENEQKGKEAGLKQGENEHKEKEAGLKQRDNGQKKEADLKHRDNESSSRAADRSRPQEQLAASGQTHEGDGIVAPHLPNGSVLVPSKVSVDADDFNGTSGPSTSGLLSPLVQDGLRPRNTLTNGNKEDVPLCFLEQFAFENKCLEETVNGLAAQMEKAENEQKQKEADLKQKEDALLLDRLLHRERKVKEQEAAARVQWLAQTWHRRCNSAGGISGATARADLAMLQLTHPLLQSTQQSPPTPNPDNEDAPAVSPTAAPMAEDDMWDKRQISYVFYLGLAVTLLILIRPLLPRVFDRIFLAVFAAIWGVGSIGLPLGIFGTSRFEKDCSRHIGRFIALCCSLMVIYAAYLLALMPLKADGTSPSPPPLPKVDEKVIIWRGVFGLIGLLVSASHVTSWIVACCTGGDRDLLP